MAVPYTFATSTSSIPLSQLDSNFATAVTLGNTAVQLGNTVTQLNNMTLANASVTATSVTFSSGTANSVVYLNSSLAATANSSALTFDGTNFATTGTASATKFIPTGGSATGNGMYLPAANTLAWSTNGAQAMTLTSGGNLLLGTTSDAANVKTNVTFTGNTQNGVRLVNTSSSGVPYALAIAYTGYSPNNTDEVVTFLDSTTTRFQFRNNGGLANFQANDVNLSDRREKTNFSPAKSYLDVICAIPVQTFNYIDQSEDDPGKTLGVVAQDVQAVAPELVSESNWGTKDNPRMRLSIYQTDLQYALMKCIQEQQALITALTARVTALESA